MKQQAPWSPVLRGEEKLLQGNLKIHPGPNFAIFSTRDLRATRDRTK
jgi:hypothetical protein